MSLEINNLQVSLDKFLIIDIHYLKLNSGGFTTLLLFILNKKYNRQFNLKSEWDLILQSGTLGIK